MNDKNLEREIKQVKEEQEKQKKEIEIIKKDDRETKLKVNNLTNAVEEIKSTMVKAEDVKVTVKRLKIYITIFGSGLAIAGAGYALYHREHNGYCKCNPTRIESLSDDMNKLEDNVNELEESIQSELEETQESLGNEISGLKGDLQDFENRYNEEMGQILDELEESNDLNSENQSDQNNVNNSSSKDNSNSKDSGTKGNNNASNKGQSQSSNSSKPSQGVEQPAPTTPPQETEKPSAPTAPPQETEKPSTPTVPPQETEKPSTPTTPPQETEKPHDHKYELIEEVKPTCTTDGYKVYKCSADESEKREVLSALGHVSGEPVSKTEGDKIITTTKCTRCGEELDRQEYDRKYELVEEVKPTCTEDGYKLYKCSIDGTEKREVIPALGHVPGEPVITETSTKKITTISCTRPGCGLKLSETSEDKLSDITIGGEGESGIGGDDIEIDFPAPKESQQTPPASEPVEEPSIEQSTEVSSIVDRNILIAQLQDYKEQILNDLAQTITFESENDYTTVIGSKVYHI